MPTELAPLPTFLIIGAQKSATRWLRTNLGEHPEVFAASQEISYFNEPDRVANRGRRWYRKQFEGWQGEPLVGEATPGYTIWRHDPAQVAAAIQDAVPDVRLIALLRNPVDRAHSAMIHHITRKRLPADADLLELVRAAPPDEERFGLVAGGWYAACLRPYLERFGDQLLVLLHDDIASDAIGLYRRAVGHIGGDVTFLPEALAEVRYSNRSRTKAEQRSLSHEQRVELFELFRQDQAELEELLGLDLSHWDPTTAAGESRTA